jgi:hypothetical protein
MIVNVALLENGATHSEPKLNQIVKIVTLENILKPWVLGPKAIACYAVRVKNPQL